LLVFFNLFVLIELLLLNLFLKKNTLFTFSQNIMKKLSLILVLFALLLGSCSIKVTKNIKKKYNPIEYTEDVIVLGLNDPIPSNAENLGTIKLGDSGFTIDCDYETVLETAKLEAREIGSNVIKITKHTPPSPMGSTCHRISAIMLKVLNVEELKKRSNTDSSLVNSDYALLHVYRFGGKGQLLSYDLHLGDSVICRVRSNWKTTLKIKKGGLNTIWARTETKEEIPIDIKFGNEYYIRCDIKFGLVVGRPSIELVKNDIARSEIDAISIKKSDLTDRIILNNGKQLNCRIHYSDSEIVFYSIIQDKKEIRKQLNKSEIKGIIMGE